MNTLYQILWVCLAIPITLLVLYALIRIISLACLHSWWDTKLWYTKKILGSLKDDSQKGKEGNHGST